MAHPTEDKQSHFSTIDGLRGLAILAVIWHHITFSLLNPTSTSQYASISDWFPVLMNGWQGVNLFFLLSGFVLSIPYGFDHRKFVSFNDIKFFYMHRAARLLPLFYFVCIVSFFLLSKSYNTKTIVGFLATLSLLFNFAPQTFSPQINWVLWSIGIEVWFSILFPFLWIIMKKNGIKKLLIFTITFSLMFRIVGQLYFRDPGLSVLNFISDSVFGRLDDFVIGMVCCIFYINYGPKIERFYFPLFIFGVGLCWFEMIGWKYWLLHSIPSVSAAFLSSMANIGMAAILLSVLCKRTFLNIIIENRIFRLLGVMCYSIYIWHGVLLTHVFSSNIYGKTSAVESLSLWGVYLVGLIALSVATFTLIEFPQTGVKTVVAILPGPRKTT